jgi:DNA-binding NtrC family response regulator
MPRILVVDDDPETCRFMNELLREPEREIELAESPEQALVQLAQGRFDLVLSDINLNAEQNGLDLLRAFKAKDPEVEVVLISAFGTLETALEAVKAGAFDYVSKPVDIGQVRDVVERALARRARAGEPRPAAFPAGRAAPDGLVGRSGGMLAVYKQIALACGSDAPVLVTGETGTGKELVARAIHRNGPRAGRPFVPVNCGALPEGLLESELFGHVRGSFTGAVADKRGLFDEARGGTLFLDEIGEMSPALQVRLLRALESGEVRPVGSTRASSVDVRVIAATHRDLERATREGRFREDLFYRLHVFVIKVPALRERREDVPLLAAHFLAGFAARGRGASALTPAALAALAAHDWPGNVRELENTLERLVAEARGATLDVGDLPPAFRSRPASLEQPLFAGLPKLEELESRYLRHVLAEVKGNRSRAAEVLGIDRRTLYRMAERFGIELAEEKTPPREPTPPRR